MDATQQAVIAKAHFRASGYVGGEDDLLEALRGIGAARVKPLYMPEAGGAGDIWFVLEFVGYTIIGGITYDLIKGSANQILRWAKKRREDGQVTPEIHSLKMTFDDVTLHFAPGAEQDELVYMGESDLEVIPEIQDLLAQHFTPDVIGEHEIQLIEVRLPGEGYEAEERPRNPRILVGKLAPFVTHEYDLKTGEFFPATLPRYRRAPDFEDWD